MSLLRRFALHSRISRPQLVQYSSIVEELKTKDSLKHNDSDTHFGFQTVKESDKWRKVHKVFEEVAASYDLMNDAMSMGVHRIWKDIFIERLSPIGNGIRLLDMAGGTGDISLRYMKYLQKLPAIDRKSSHVTVCDINQNMLDVGQKRWEKLNLPTAGDTIEWVCADAEKLPFDDSSFSVYTIAFGIRNCTHIDRVLAEAYRVLQPGGRFMCLEFSHVNNEYLKWAYDQYSFQVIPPMGQILANQWQPYQYLVESIRKFPLQNEFKKMIENAGFKCVQFENLTFGVVAIHSGFKL
ncbi:2-methoxy-6-polyprenyl-1,4-benzoquinol methylase, mitochondrial [Anopheles marshallii]|uniref:2-methoxy-6-polyprenyl-1,4-benzoquinol methylase, mitochondrial n=1 Tax=Anopheles marshallii TaxID=1521116 RepID=UPI00237C437B|nr:2-methoxy-6-polyprenyl-1,4-benzoquinol methylase, mitochondrial [Anopheles marshallii]